MALLTPTILLMFALVGALAGLLAGLFGIGGGLILIPMFLWAFKLAGFAPQIIVHLAFGTSLAIIIPTAVSSALGHRKRGNVDWHLVLRMACGSVVGVADGSSLAAGLSG
ncbi:MAG: sulfite exporter TauE/SafE family protein, partial [Desulfuromonas sp.]|nr:sulfite exporter TauE/SafE family protein [Desulfuromonas sp.]